MAAERSGAHAALNRLCKWRTVFVGWQLGTRPYDDPEAQAVRDHRELSMILRAEVSALTRLMIEKRVFDPHEFDAALAEEADALSESFATQFPGIRATDTGLEMDTAVMQERGTMKGWRP